MLSLVATLGVTLLGTDGSSAMAEASVAMPDMAASTARESMTVDSVSSTDSNVQNAPKFISQPVVQPVPVLEMVEAGGLRDASSLAQLVSEEPVPGQLDKQMQCLAGAIYFESKGEPLAGQLAVGRVVIARAESNRFPSSYCGVVYQRAQFSFVRGGRMPSINKSSRAWQRAKKVAMIAHDNAWKSDAEGALYFHAHYVSPRWKNAMTRLATIDNHIFYR